MKIVICGAGEVGSHAAEILAAVGHSITIVDTDSRRLAAIEETIDARTLVGNCAEANQLREADVGGSDMLVAATDCDEVNLLTAASAKALGAAKAVARVHHKAYFDSSALDYQQHFNIDRLICPEFSTAQAIARTLRNPGAVAIENFARGRIEMQEFTASESGLAINQRLMDIKFPPGTRLAMIGRKHEARIPEAKSVVVPGDTVIMVGNTGAFEVARRFFHDDKHHAKRLVLMGGPPIAVWLCRTLRDRSNFSIRLFERDPVRAAELAEKLDEVTVIQADPTDRAVFEEEHLSRADVFVSLLDNDEANIIAGVLAKTRGVTSVMTVVQRPKYMDLVFDIGVDRAFSPRMIAGEEIDNLLDDRPLRHMGSLAEGSVDVFRVRVGDRAKILGKQLRDVNLSPDWVVAAIQRDREAHVPGAEDVIHPGDVVLVVGMEGRESSLKKIFAVK